ncbi:MAG: cystathionine beta-lyase [Hyphomicrobiales bacterium]|nr:cystathionine beta-lyase [Hyphomicrobiales bacterium]
MATDESRESAGDATLLAHLGRNSERQDGLVNTPVTRASTILFPDLKTLRAGAQEYSYGRHATPVTKALQDALAQLEGAHAAFLTSCGLAAVTTAILSAVRAGDHILVADCVYDPTRKFCTEALPGLGVSASFFDPLIGADIAGLITPQTKAVFLESPGSLTFEVSDVAAIADAAHQAGAKVLLDNSWATPLFFKSFRNGVDISVHSVTKYISGHADGMCGAILANEHAAGDVERMRKLIGQNNGADEAYLALRGLRSLEARLSRQAASALEIARWLETRPEVARVLYPALENDPGYRLWQRDFTGAASLFSVVLHPCTEDALARMVDGMRLFSMGYSWGAFESLILPSVPIRSATEWNEAGPLVRIYIGLEDPADLKQDLEAALKRLG